MPTQQEMLIEADRRGLLKGEKKARFDEAVKRGLIQMPSANQGAPEAGSGYRLVPVEGNPFEQSQQKRDPTLTPVEGNPFDQFDESEKQGPWTRFQEGPWNKFQENSGNASDQFDESPKLHSRAKLESALRNAHKAGDTAAAKKLANALMNGEYAEATQMSVELPNGTVIEGIPRGTSREAIKAKAIAAGLAKESDFPSPAQPDQGQQEDLSILRDLDSAFMKIPGAPALAEFAAAANRSVFDMVDFLGPDTVNAVLEIAGSNKRIPTTRETFGSAGGYMEEGLARDVVQGAGELAPQAAAFGQMLRTMAGRMPAFSQGESAARGTLREMGSGTAKQDVVGGAMAGAGAAVGEEVGGETGELIGGTAGAMAGGVPELIKRAFRGGEAGRQSFKAAVDDFAEVGRSPTLGQASGDGVYQGIENFSGTLFGGAPVRRAIEGTSKAMQKRIGQIADDLSSTRGDVEAGRVIERGITGPGGFVDRFQAQTGRLWNKFDGLIDDTAPVSATNTQEALGRLVNSSQFGKVLNNPLISQIKTMFDDAGGQIDYSTFRQLRSAIGERLGSKDLVSDIPRAQLKQLYGALSQDLKGVAAQYGDEAVKALERANRVTRAGHNRLDGFVERIVKKADLDKVFQAATRGGEGIQSMNAVKRALKPEEWEVVASNVLRRLGRANSGQQDDLGEVFSVSKFLTDWDKLGRAKGVLLSGSDKLNGYRKNLDKIASAASRFKDSAGSMQNPSGTGQFLANVGTLTGAGAAVGSGNLDALGLILAGVAANSGAARLMTSPRFVGWLARGLDTSNWAAHISRLTGVSQTPEQAEAVAELLATIQRETQSTNPVPLESRKAAPQRR